MNKLYYRVADLDFAIENESINPFYLYNYAPFRTTEEEVSSLLFEVSFKELPEISGKQTRINEIDHLTLYIYLSKDGCSVKACSKITGKEYRLRARRQWTSIEMNLTFEEKEEYDILNYFLMLAFIYSSSFHDTVLIHASCVCRNDCAVAFLGDSGVGKSTHSRLWLEHVAGVTLLNDDQPAARLINGEPYLYGTPWSGKTHCYKNERARLNSLFLMKQADKNEVTPLSPFAAFRRLLAFCSMIQEERMTFNCIVKTLIAIAENAPAFQLENRPEREAVKLAYINSIGRKSQGESEHLV